MGPTPCLPGLSFYPCSFLHADRPLEETQLETTGLNCSEMRINLSHRPLMGLCSVWIPELRKPTDIRVGGGCLREPEPGLTLLWERDRGRVQMHCVSCCDLHSLVNRPRLGCLKGAETPPPLTAPTATLMPQHPRRHGHPWSCP